MTNDKNINVPCLCKVENNLISVPLNKRDLELEVDKLPPSPIESTLEFFPPIFHAALHDRWPLSSACSKEKISSRCWLTKSSP